MRIVRLLATVLSLTVCAWSAQFYNGQAARAVIGQPSFSAAGTGVSISSIRVAYGRLYVTDAAQQTIAFDLSAISAPEADPAGQGSGCAVCGFKPVAAAHSSPLPANLATFGKTVVLADTPNHRVLIWRNTRAVAQSGAPDVILGGSAANSGSPSATAIEDPVSVAFDGHRLFVGDAALHRVLVWNSLPESDDQPADAVLGQPDFATADAPEGPDAETIGDPVALASDGTNLFVADSTYHRILMFSVADTPLKDDAITNAASFRPGALAAGTLVDIRGTKLADATVSAPDDGIHALPAKLGGVEAIFDGVPLPLLSVSAGEVRAQLPYKLGEANAGSIYIRTEHTNGTVSVSSAANVKIAAASPGLFAFGGGQEPRSGLVVHASAKGQSGAPVTGDNPAAPGQVVVLWAAGLGAVHSGKSAARMGVPFAGQQAQIAVPVQAIVAGRHARVLSSVLPAGSIGVYEIRVLLPADLPVNLRTPLLVVQNGTVSNTVTFPVMP
ncbi:MAG: hypothetical protein ACRD6B_25180 [Bryobacteraceae bacterium]